MTLVGKVLVFVNMLLASFFMIGAVLVYDSRVDYRERSDKAQQSEQITRRKLTAIESELQDEKNKVEANDAKHKEEATALRNEIAELKQTLERRRTELAAAQEERDTNAIRLKHATDETVQRRGEIEQMREINATLRSEVAELVDERTDLQDSLAQAQNELEVVSARNQSITTDLDQLEAYVRRKEGQLPDRTQLEGVFEPPPPNVEGIVRRVDSTGKFIQLSLGSDDGIQENHELQVWRSDPQPKYLGVVRIVQVDATESVAKPVSTTGLIRPGDRVGANIFVNR